MSRSPIPDLPADDVSAILTFARERGARTAHYVGNADRALIEGLIGLVGKDGVSIMDVSNRWGSGSRYFRDEFESSGAAFPECPSWLEGIVCYEEGAPERFDLLIRDVRWDFPKQLGAIIASRERKHPKIPSIAVMLEARKVAVPADYESSEIGEITFISRIK
jgi:hypothetical protein